MLLLLAFIHFQAVSDVSCEGNLLLDRLCGAQIYLTPRKSPFLSQLQPRMEKLAQHIKWVLTYNLHLFIQFAICKHFVKDKTSFFPVLFSILCLCINFSGPVSMRYWVLQSLSEWQINRFWHLYISTPTTVEKKAFQESLLVPPNKKKI